MVAPVIVNYTTATKETSVSGQEITITYPTGIVSGDLLVVLVVNDKEDSNIPDWDNVNNKPTGFTLINTSGNSVSDCHSTAFYKIATGSESGSFIIPTESSLNTIEQCAWCIRITGHSNTPITIVGSETNSVAAATSLSIEGITTLTNDCLVLGLTSFDGADMIPASISGSGWSKHSELAFGISGGSSSGCLAIKTQLLIGATGDCVVASANSDGISGFMFAINPVVAPTGSSILTMPIITIEAYGDVFSTPVIAGFADLQLNEFNLTTSGIVNPAISTIIGTAAITMPPTALEAYGDVFSTPVIDGFADLQLNEFAIIATGLINSEGTNSAQITMPPMALEAYGAVFSTTVIDGFADLQLNEFNLTTSGIVNPAISATSTLDFITFNIASSGYITTTNNVQDTYAVLKQNIVTFNGRNYREDHTSAPGSIPELELYGIMPNE